MELDLSQFWTAFLAAVTAFYPQDLDPGNLPQSQVKESYDFIIVGGGTAGSVLANRLSEEAGWSVVVLEAGGPETLAASAPLLTTTTLRTDLDWNYTTLPQARACRALDGVCSYPRGHVLGGSSTINGMMYVRGNKADYDGWVKLGCTGWSYKDVLPYFIKSENCTEPSFCNSPLHGRDGYLNVQYPRYVTEMREEYVRAGEEFGWTNRDYNTFLQDETIDFLQFTMDGPSRESTSDGYLLPVQKRKNLNIIQRALVSKILINKTKAKGVEYYRNGQKHIISANKEVIISAGAINTPQLLMLSGIGPKEELMKHNIDVIADLPVGKHLQDHIFTPVTFKLNQSYTLRSDIWRTNESIYEYAIDRKGPLTATAAEATAFFNPLNKSEPPNSQIIMYSAGRNMSNIQNENIIQMLCVILQPKSLGSVTLSGTSIFDKPVIDPNYFGEDSDYLLMKKVVERALDLMKTPTMSRFSPELDLRSEPKCRGLKTRQEEVACLVEQYSQTVYHPVATARMGHPQDEGAVVSPNLMVRGFRNLRVVDASVMPVVPRANI